MSLPSKVLINGVEIITQKMCPMCNRRLRFGIQPNEMTCLWFCETGDYTSEIQKYENVPTPANLPWRQ
jgi:hypothetical protein